MLTAALLAALPGLIRPEPFSAFEQSGNIWGRDEATGREWQISDWPGMHPDVAAYTAVWETWNGAFPTFRAFPVYISAGKGIPTEPRLGVVATAGWGDYWCAWRMNSDIWAIRIKPPLLDRHR